MYANSRRNLELKEIEICYVCVRLGGFKHLFADTDKFRSLPKIYTYIFCIFFIYGILHNLLTHFLIMNNVWYIISIRIMKSISCIESMMKISNMPVKYVQLPRTLRFLYIEHNHILQHSLHTSWNQIIYFSTNISWREKQHAPFGFFWVGSPPHSILLC